MIRLLTCFSLLFMLTACGVQGDLSLPDTKSPQQHPVNERIQDGDDDVNTPL